MVNEPLSLIAHSEDHAPLRRGDGEPNWVDDLRLVQKEWVERVMAARGWNAGEWAEKAGLSPSTVSRFLNSQDHKFLLTYKTLSKLAGAAKVAMPTAGSDMDGTGFGEPELQPLITGEEPNATRSTWLIKGNAMQFSGFLAGDSIEFDHAIMPQIDDIVLAQVYDNSRGTAETVMRVYAPPYLLAAASHPSAYPPLYVDGNNVKIVGVMVKSWRERPDRRWLPVGKPSAA
jgi:transcriptional regulator with XRE-family HTH domain